VARSRTAWIARSIISVGAVLFCLASLRCSNSTPTGPAPNPPGPAQPIPPGTTPTIPIPVPTQIFVGAGDIGWCGSPGTPETGKLLDSIGGDIFAAGDIAYMTGTAQQFRDCYDPFWGRFRGRVHAVPGNHEYEGAGPGPYFNYFGGDAGPVAGLGYYSFPLGAAWHVIALNSSIDVSAGGAQGQWLRQELALNQKKCTIAFWHHPLFSSGQNGDQPQMRDFWRLLYAAGVDIVIAAHDHLYERFAPQDPDGRPDPAKGIRQFIAGTGGAQGGTGPGGLYNFVTTKPNSEVRISAFGVLKLTLETESYRWDFVPVGSGQSDSGPGVCH
jgi:hypothetical protein